MQRAKLYQLGLWGATALVTLCAGAVQTLAQDVYLPWEGGPAYYAQFSLGPSSSQDYFMRAVWLQSPSKAGFYQAVGVNQFVGLWDGTVETSPKEGAILPLLRNYKMPVFGEQESGLAGADGARHLNDPIIDGWIQVDEPDNAQSQPGGGYGDCILPAAIISKYKALKAADPKRPVYLGVGQGTGYNSGTCYDGRGGTCCSAARGLNDYPLYAQGGDILASDVYPENDAHPLWWVGRTTDRLRYWSNYQKPVLQDIELVNFNNSFSVTLTSAEIAAESWMTIIHGGRGLLYFVHQFAPVQEEDSIFHLEHADVKAAVAATNIQVAALARVLNTPSVSNGVTVTSSSAHAAINVLLKRYGGCTFLLAINDGLPQNQTPSANPIEETSLFCRGSSLCTDSVAAAGGAVSMSRAGATTATFTLRDFPAHATAIVLGERRQIPVSNRVFSDAFASSYAWHLYQFFFDPNSKAALIGDVNGDGKVDSSDVLIVKAAMGTVAGQPGYDPRADVIRDGTVDSADLAMVEEAMRRQR
ncbi:MAG: dockerin type I domain-containing protein [Terriglobia bacterium]|jgi:hypothetical protein